jgi:hypothetical protein
VSISAGAVESDLVASSIIMSTISTASTPEFKTASTTESSSPVAVLSPTVSATLGSKVLSGGCSTTSSTVSSISPRPSTYLIHSNLKASFISGSVSAS